MKKTSDTLFRLIKSMTQNEKRYFKRFVQQHTIGGKNKYVELFDKIHNLEVYDEQVVLKSIKDKMLIKNFAVHKRYLYQQILKTLRNFQSKKSIHIQLYEQLLEGQILYNKGIYDGCKSLINKTIKMALKYEYFTVVMDLNSLRMSVALEEGDYKVIKKYTEEIYSKEVKLLHKTNKITFHQKRQLELYLDYQNQSDLNKDYSFDEEKYSIDGFNVSRLYYNAEYIKGMIRSNHDSLYQNAKAQYELYLNAPHQIPLYTEGFIIAAVTYISSCQFLRYATEGLETIDDFFVQMMQIYKKGFVSKNTFLNFHSVLEFHRLVFHHLRGDTERIKTHYRFCKLELLPQLDNHIYPSHHLLFLTGLATTEILLNKMDEALSTLYKYNNLRPINHRPDVESFMRMLTIIVNFEKKNYRILDSLISTTYQFMREKNRLNKFEKLFLSFFKNKILKQDSLTNSKLVSLFQQFKKDVNQVLEVKMQESKIYNQFDFLLWVESKIQNKPMFELVQNKSLDG